MAPLLCGSDSRGLHEHKGLELSTKRVLEEVCELGVPERNVLGVAMEGSDHVTESGKRLVDILSLTSLITSHTGPRETLRSSEVNEVETGSAGGSCLLVLFNWMERTQWEREDCSLHLVAATVRLI